MQVAQIKNIRAMLALMKSKGYKINERPYELNIVGVRHNSTESNKFDDYMYVFFKDDSNKWIGKYYTITTDPGTYWLKNPMNVDGTSILKEGQYIDAYKVGLHRGEYEALVQQKPVIVIRDYDRNAMLDFNNGKEIRGLYGINIHRATSKGTSKNVDKWSAGCQVFENSDDFANFLTLAKKHRDLYGNNFTYTLVDERAYIRMLKRRGTYLLAIGLVVASFVGYKLIKKNI